MHRSSVSCQSGVLMSYGQTNRTGERREYIAPLASRAPLSVHRYKAKKKKNSALTTSRTYHIELLLNSAMSHKMDPPTAAQQSLRAYDIAPALESYEIPVDTYISQNSSDQLVGVLGTAVIIHQDRVLLIQRVADDDYPDLWEVPGGVADDGETIIECVVRELREETGLRASAISTMLGEFEWEDSIPVSSSHPRRGKWKIFTFLVVVDGLNEDHLDITLDSREHKAFLWVTDKEVGSDLCGDVTLDWISLNQKEAILTAFKKVSTAV